ncbi:DUF456 domain-containing protein [Spongiivirga citrea]|uniref:DUF456 family protein n=1 Tax=Spongiivirga citrea TaxID=1481457 RepID=A0A6M0CGE6_9FLAO|nr:DUF456 domain-containing protein [Spongiivirga citrea]NER16901.1 DUF456 family protein [Spongiivirga citrea]
MDIILVLFGLLFIFLGLIGSFLPVLPGPPLSWIGLLLLHLTKAVPSDPWFLGITFVIAIAVFVLDYLIPIAGTKRFGGSKAGMLGTTLGLIVAIVFPILGFFGIIIWPFVGALIGELINKADEKTAMKAAFGSFIGFLTGTFLKFMVAAIYAGFFFYTLVGNASALFSFDWW